MSQLLRSLLYPYLAPTGADGDPGGGGTDTIEGGGEDTLGGGTDTVEGGGEDTIAGAGEDTIEGAKDEPIESQMLKAIEAGLKKEPPAGETKPVPGEPAKAKPGEATPDPKKVEADAKAKEEADRAALRAKKADDFQLSPEEKKALSGKANTRFRELHGYAKEREAEAAELKAVNAEIVKHRDSIMGVFEDYKITGKELVPLLELHLSIKEGRYEEALKVVDEARADILTALGREAPGVDLLKDFPDLAGMVESQEMTREAALEVANARRVKAGADHQRSEQTAQQRAVQERQQAEDKALDSISAWTKSLSTSDIDYKAKEAKLLATGKDGLTAIQRVMKDYPPAQWLGTIKLLYEGIVVDKQPAASGTSPLRPSGAKGGERQFSELTPDALAAGLGYTTMPN
jgi:hypothetical protein